MTETMRSGSEALTRFAQGLQEDLAAVQAGLTLPWSNEHVAYCPSSPASWPLEGTDPPATTVWRDRLWGNEHPGAAIMIARPHHPAAAIPAPHGLFADAQGRRNRRRRSHPHVPYTGEPILQTVRAAALGHRRGLEG